MIKVSCTQRGNKLLDVLGAMSWCYDKTTTADYEVDGVACVLFLSLKFHASRPTYIHSRIEGLCGRGLHVLMVLVDTPNHGPPLQEIFGLVPIAVVLCKSHEECARYLRGFQLCSRRDAEALRKKDAGVESFLCAFPKMNRTDARSLMEAYGSIQNIFSATEREIAGVSGMGAGKVGELLKYMHRDFNDV